MPGTGSCHLYFQEKHAFLPDFICKMHVKDIFAALYIGETIAFLNITKIKHLWIKYTHIKSILNTNVVKKNQPLE